MAAGVITISLKQKAISGKINEGKVDMDTTKANSVKSDMVKQLDKISTCATKAYKLIKKIDKEKAITGDFDKIIKVAKGGLKKRADQAEKSGKKLTKVFDADVQKYAMDVLTAKYNDLLARVEALEKNNK